MDFLNRASLMEYVFICYILPLKTEYNSPGCIHFFHQTNNVFVYTITILPVTNGIQV